MRNYKKPNAEFVEILCEDVIMTSNQGMPEGPDGDGGASLGGPNIQTELYNWNI